MSMTFLRIAFIPALALSLLVFSSAVSAEAKDKTGGGYQTTAQQGGYSGPTLPIMTVEEAKKLADDAHVSLKGYIVQHLGGDEYLFKDKTGTINVEISSSRWRGQNIGAEDLVEIQGEVDKDWSTVEIDVKWLNKQ